MEPVAWACFAETGNIRIWSPDQEPVRKAAEREGWEITPLYAMPGSVYLVCAQWEYEGNEDLAAFRDRCWHLRFILK